MTPKPFRHIIEIYGVKLEIAGSYYPGMPATHYEPADDSVVDVESVTVPGTEFNLMDLISERVKTRIDEAIDKIEAEDE